MTNERFDRGRDTFWLRFGMLRGGRVTKVAGRDASYAPQQGVSVESHGGIAAALTGAFATVAKVGMLPLLLASGASAAYAQDACGFVAPPNSWACSDGGAAASSEIVLDMTGTGQSATVSLNSDFLIDTVATGTDRGLVLLGDEGIVVSQSSTNPGDIRAHADALQVTNSGAGDVFITLFGDLYSYSGHGAVVSNDGGVTSFSSAGSITGTYGLAFNHTGNAGGSVTVTDVYADNTALSIQTGATSTNLSVAVNGTVNSQNGVGLDLYHQGSAFAFFDTRYGSVSGDAYGIDAHSTVGELIGFAGDVTGDVGIRIRTDTGTSYLEIADGATVTGTVGEGVLVNAVTGLAVVRGTYGGYVNGATSGIAVSNSGGDVSVFNLDSVSGGTGPGIAINATGSVDISSITNVSSASGTAIDVYAGGDVGVSGIDTVSGATGGIAIDADGYVYLSDLGPVTTSDGAAISVDTLSGLISITGDGAFAEATSTNGDGIVATSNSGAINIDTVGGTVSGANNGIVASIATGSAPINITTGNVYATNAEGVAALAYGNVTVDTTDGYVTGTYGVSGTSTGGIVSITTADVAGSVKGIVADGATGVVVDSSAGDVVADDRGIDVLNGLGGAYVTAGDVTSTSSDAIHVFAVDGVIDIDVVSGAVVDGGDNGILAVGNGSATVDTVGASVFGASNGIAVNSSDGVTITTGNVDAASFDAVTALSSGDITIDTSAGFLSAGGAGIAAYSTNGLISITSGIIDAGGDGIAAYADSGVTIDSTGGLVDAAERGIEVYSNDGLVDITTGQVEAVTGEAIYVRGTGGAIQVDTTGDVRSSGNTAILANNFGGTSAVDTVGTTVTGNLNGIAAYGSAGTNVTSGDVFAYFGSAITTLSGAQTTIDASAGTLYAQSYGVTATVLSGNGTSITTGAIIAGDDGVYVYADNSTGDIDITTGAIDAGGSGVDVYANHSDTNISITTGGDVTGGDYGVHAFLNNGDGSITLDTTGGTVTTSDNVAVYAVARNGTADVSITTGDVVTTGNTIRSIGVIGYTEAGDITVDTSAGTVQTGDIGVLATTPSGDVVVTTADVTAGSTWGIRARSRNGSVTIDSTAGAVFTSGSIGVYARAMGASGDGGAYATASVRVGDVTGTFNDGVLVDTNNFSGDVYLYVGGAVQGGGSYGNGVHVTNQGYGDTSIILGTYADISSANADGILVEGTGAGDTLIQGSSGVILGADDGINVNVIGDIVVADIDSVTGLAGDGLDLTSSAGTITVSNIGTIEGFEHGILATAPGDISIQGIGSVVGDGASGSLSFLGPVGIRATNFGTNGDLDIGGTTAIGDVTGGFIGVYTGTQGAVTIDTSAGTTTGGDFGIVNLYASSLQITTADVVGTGEVGIIALATGDITLDTTRGTVTGRRGGIEAESDDGNVTITTGDVATTNLDAIQVYAPLAIDIDTTAGSVTSGGRGIIAYSSDATGSIAITTADVTSDNGTAIRAIAPGAITIDTSDGSIAADGASAFAIEARINDPYATGDMTIDVADATSVDGTAVFALNEGAGDITIDVDGTVTGDPFGIEAETENGGDISVTLSADTVIDGRLGALEIDHSGTAIVDGGGAALASDFNTVQVEGDGSIFLSNLGVVTQTASGLTRSGIIANSQYGDVVLDGVEAVESAQRGIYLISRSGSVTGSNIGKIVADGAIGVWVLSTLGDVSLSNIGSIEAGGVGISVSDDPASLTIDTVGSIVAGVDGILARVAGDIEILRLGSIDAGDDGIDAIVSGVDSTITLDLDGDVTARVAAVRAVAGGGGSIDIDTAGTLGSYSDVALDLSGGDWTVDNDGTIIGTVGFGDGNDTLGNWSGNSVDLRNFVDTGMDGVRDQEAVAINDFGAGDDAFANGADGVVNLLTVADETGFTAETSDDTDPGTWDPSDEYVVVAAENVGGTVHQSITTDGVEQAHLVNLEMFTNSGAIVMQDAMTGGSAAIAGDVIVITGAAAAGTDGDGLFVSDGGSLYLDTLLGDGNGDISDTLVVDGTSVAAGGATTIYIESVTPGSGAGTDLDDNGMWDEGEGILLVSVLDAAASADDAFELYTIVYDNGLAYDLYHGATGGDWYLANVAGAADTGFCGGDVTLSTGVFLDALGCASDDSLTLEGDVSVDVVEGAGGADTIIVRGDADAVGGVYGGGDGQDMSADLDTGDTITIDTTGVVGTVDGQLGDDAITIANGDVDMVTGNVGDDTILVTGGSIDSGLLGGAGDDAITVTGGFVDGLDGEDGADAITIAGGTLNDVYGGDGIDTITLTGGTVGSVDGEAGDDVIFLNGAVAVTISGGAGDDSLRFSSGSVDLISGGDGNDDIDLTGGPIGSVDAGAGDDSVNLALGTIDGALVTGDGNDRILIDEGYVGSVDSGSGDDLFQQFYSFVDGPVVTGAGDDRVAMVEGRAGSLDTGDGDDRIQIEGTDITVVTSGSGSDSVLLQYFDLAGATLDGGDDLSAADGMIDTLTFDYMEGALDSATITNFEIVEIADRSDMTLDGGFAVGSDVGTGLYVMGGSTLSSSTGFDLAGNLTIAGDSAMMAMGASAIELAIANDLMLSGMADLRNGMTGDTISVGGDFVGGGTLGLDVDFADLSADMLSVAGDVSGVTTIALDVANADAAGGDPITLVTADGAISDANFTLEGGAFLAGIYLYDLELDGQSIVLANALVPTAPAMEALPMTLAGFAEMGTLHDRVGSGIALDEEGHPRLRAGLWGTFDAEWSDLADPRSTFETSVDADTTRWTVGGTFMPFDKLAASASVRRTDIDAEIGSIIGMASLDADALGVGGALTFMDGGFYVDAQLRADWIDFAISSDQFGQMDQDADARTRGASLEAGYRLALSPSVALTPQAQLGWHDLKIDTFTGPLGATYDDDHKNDWKSARVGLRLDAGAGAGKDGLTAFAIGNVRHVFDPMMQGQLSGYQLSSYLPETTGELGAGAQYQFAGGRVTAFAKGGYTVDLSGDTEYDKASVNVGVRIGF